MTSQGNAYSRFQRALKTGNPNIVTTAALELPQVSLIDAAKICAVYAESDPKRFETAAVRWLFRLCDEHPGTPIDDVVTAAAAFDLMRSDRRRALETLTVVARRAS